MLLASLILIWAYSILPYLSNRFLMSSTFTFSGRPLMTTHEVGWLAECRYALLENAIALGRSLTWNELLKWWDLFRKPIRYTADNEFQFLKIWRTIPERRINRKTDESRFNNEIWKIVVCFVRETWISSRIRKKSPNFSLKFEQNC